MSVPSIINQAPSFADLSKAGVPAGEPAPPGQQPVTPPAGVAGGQAVAPTPAAGNSMLRQYEAQGLVPAGRFTNDAEMVDALYNLATNLASRQDAQPPEAPAPAKPVQPVQPVSQQPQAVKDISQIATTFQQHGLLSYANGQWVATNPMAASVAEQLNAQIIAAQARQAELADPDSFIRRYGTGVIQEALTPLGQELQQMKAQYQALQQTIEALMPKPYEGWVRQHESQLFSIDPATQTRVHTPAGKAYDSAWTTAYEAGVRDVEKLHTIASSTAQPYLQQAAPATQPAAKPAVPWASTVQPSGDTGFNAPGSQMGRAAGSTGISVPVGNDGMPSFSLMLAQGTVPQ